MKRILGLDLGTNSIGWALIKQDFENKKGKIIDVGSRIIPMDQSQLTDFEKGNTVSSTAQRTSYRGVRRLYQRDNLRRERLHRVLNIIGFLPEHYKEQIDFKKNKGQFINEVKLNYKLNGEGRNEFIFMDSFNEMILDFKKDHSNLFYKKKNGEQTKIPYDWTLYYLRKKALNEKVSKQELAWIILNFNQKRGYYQLRGEEEEIQDGKTKTFEVLKVSKIVDTGEVLKGKDIKLYDIYFENGWKYDKQTTKPEIWEAKTKEFIVTTSKTKDGNVKRSFKNVNSEEDWIAIKAKTEQEIEQSGKHISEFIYDNLRQKPTQKIRGKLIKTIERKYYKKELEAILETQIKLHPELQSDNIYQKCVTELYPRNEAHQNKLLGNKNKFKHLIIEDIIFYQRPLKSQKGSISGCQYEKRPRRDKEGKLLLDDNGKPILIPIRVTSKSNPLFQEFRLWQWLHNLKIYKNKKEIDGEIKLDVDITGELLPSENARVELFDYLATIKEVDLEKFLKYFTKKGLIDKQKKGDLEYSWNYPEDKKYPMYETRSGILSRLKKVEDIKNPLQFLTPEIEKHLWHIIYSVSDANEFKIALGSFAEKYGLDKESFVSAFIKMPPYKSDYASYSEKAIKKILPLMRLGKYWQEDAVLQEIKDRILVILERVEALNLPESPSKKQINEAFEKYQVVDDDIPQQIVKSFIPLINKNPFSGLNTYQAGYAVYGRHSESGDIQYWRTPQDIDKFLDKFSQHSLRNPIVEQVVLETMRTVRDIWINLGQGNEGFFNEIHLELGRDLKNSAEKRKKISSRNTENERTNIRIRALLNELVGQGAKPHSPSHQEILKIYEEGVLQNPKVKYDSLKEEDVIKIRRNNKPSSKDMQKYKLWLEQKYISPYTGKTISLTDLFTKKYQIEHIIPQSRYFDNSMSNKVICESTVNEYKSNQTAYEFIKDKGGSKVALGDGNTVKLYTFKEYEAHCNRFFEKSKQKLKNLLTDDIPEGFIKRQMNDSRYISKLIKGLLSNIVRAEGEQAITSKNLLPVTGVITSKLKQDWGLNDKWNELILPRFKRLNVLTNSQDFTYLNDKNIEVPTVPDELKSGFNKKRIDHRHHALDALVIASCTRKHIQYINSLNNEKEKFDLQPSLMIKNKEGHYTKYFQFPWEHYPVDVKNALESTIISFKKNTRVLTKTNNKYWKYVLQKDGTYKKELVKQKNANRAIRKPLHKETIFGKLKWKAGVNKIYAATRVSLVGLKEKQIDSITDKSIQKILINHLKQDKYQNQTDEKGKKVAPETLAFSPEGIEDLNKNIQILNGGKPHHPIYKARKYEESSKFSVSENINSPKHKKYVEAAKGTNLFFNIYKDDKNNRTYETVPLNEVIAHQKWRASLSKTEQKSIPLVPAKNIIKNKEVELLFTLSPNDLVYVPTDDEINQPDLVNLEKLEIEQIKRIFVVNDFSSAIYFTPNHLAKNIAPKEVDLSFDEIKGKIKGSYDTKTASYCEVQIKEVCWKLITNRLGSIIKVEK